MGYIYRIINKTNGKSYIGQTIQPIEDRWNQHIKTSYKKDGDNKKCAIHYALQKYGIENFIFTIVEEVEEEQLDDREKYWIKEYNTFIDNGQGYNMTYGGEGRVKADGEKILSLWKQGKTITEISQITGYSKPTCSVHLKEKKNTLKEIYERRSNYNSKNCSLAILQYSLQGDFIKKWESLAEVRRILGYQQSLLSCCINKKVRQAYGYLWIKDGDSIDDAIARYKDKKFKRNRPVIQYSLNDEIIKIWESAELAGNTLLVDPTAIRRCCRQLPKYKTSKGFKWRYADEVFDF